MSQKIEVIAIKGDIVKKSEMTYRDALEKKEEYPDWRFLFYQIGFSSFKETK